MHGICSELYRNPLGRAVEIISSISEAAVSSNSVTIKVASLCIWNFLKKKTGIVHENSFSI
ncbi:hypothetical protein T08_14420 [Trichinella sp. T8]|nr:hypothetical protein T08_10084 [Trichinella sp. T8]KRZ92615.1 hypothetical protein T08_11550 [Trichinella sp. T8]KRZ92694.1 hypothetical protein T08_14420 [Trichinella sp. T8]